jgi:flagellar hook protein FlgE
MFAGVSGLRAHQAMMDVIGNNIANVNTVGYKASQVSFEDLLSQTISGATPPQAGRGGTNPQQIGLGVKLASITQVFTQGALQATGRSLDLAIQGDGFFILNDGGRDLYSRAGGFSLDNDGNVVNPANGMRVQGWMADVNGAINTNGTVGNITIPIGMAVQPKATQNVGFTGNIDARELNGTTYQMPITVRDSQGNPHDMVVTLTKNGNDTWDYAVTIDAAIPTTGDSGQLVFDVNGALDVGASTINSPITITPTNGADVISIVPDFSALTQYGSIASAAATNQDGYTSGNLQEVIVSNTGVVSGIFSNGISKALGQIAMANFNNPSGLIKQPGGFYLPSPNSGIAQTGQSGARGLGTISAGTLEMSNVDLAQEFTNMIIAQRGFQANSRIITTSDEMLQELVNLKR